MRYTIKATLAGGKVVEFETDIDVRTLRSPIVHDAYVNGEKVTIDLQDVMMMGITDNAQKVN